MSDLVFLGFGTFLFILTAALREPQASLKERNMYEPLIGLGVAIVSGSIATVLAFGRAVFDFRQGRATRASAERSRSSQRTPWDERKAGV